MAWHALAGAALLSTCGCVAFWEEVTSRERDLNYVWRKPDPLIVLRDSTDNARKAEALSRLGEPLSRGGSQEEQELFIQILSRAALNEGQGQYEPMSRDPLCRLSAIRTLGDYKDPRAVAILEKAYLEAQPFTPEMNAVIRQQALVALEKTANPEARHILIRAARQPSATAVSSQTERQYVLDEKLAAVRALGKYPQFDSVETLVHLLETDRDVAIRHCAHNSLKTATKRDLPAEPQAWRNLLAQGPEAAPPQPSLIERVTGTWSREEGKK
jgi:HEAT repeat protein